MPDTFICPICGTEVDINAVVCPECGSDDETGWSKDTVYDGLFLYDDDTPPSKQRPKAHPWVKYVIPALILITLSAFLATVIPWGIYLVPVILIGAGIAYYFMDIAPRLRVNQENKLYQALLTRAQGDYAMVERWISYERQRNPDAGEVQLMESALYRWKRDNR